MPTPVENLSSTKELEKTEFWINVYLPHGETLGFAINKKALAKVPCFHKEVLEGLSYGSHSVQLKGTLVRVDVNNKNEAEDNSGFKFL